MTHYIINTFLPSAVEIFSICCILGMLNNIYKNSNLKIAIIVIVLTCITTGLDIFDFHVNVGVNTFLIVLLIWPLYKLKFPSALFDAISITAIYLTLQNLLILAISSIDEALPKNDNFVSIAISIMAICIFSISKVGKVYHWSQKIYGEYKSELRWVFINLFVIYQFYMIEWNESYYQLGSLKPLFIISFILILILNLILMFHILKLKRQSQEIAKQNELNEMSEKFSDQLAAKQHEFSKHLQVIKGMSENKSIAKTEISNYINGLIEERETESKLVYTGDAAISSYLLERKREALDKGINLNALIGKPLPTFPCSRYELIEIIGNLLNNSFEAVLSLENKDVFLEISKADEKSFIKVINGLDSNVHLDLSEIVQKGFSTKQGEIRGYGLDNIKKIAEANGGKMEISANGEIIQIKILF